MIKDFNALLEFDENKVEKHLLEFCEDFIKPIYVSECMKETFATALRVCCVCATVLLLGESGTGKEVLARFIHSNSPRRDKAFVTVNCGAIPENLLESELFGYDRGAFTGALKNGKPGLFELADGGTLFLDEIGELPISMQVKILRALESKSIMRVGGYGAKKINVRIITATNRQLLEMVKKKTFREDLYYRLNVVPIILPPLRKRKVDIMPLSVYFLNYYNKLYDKERQFGENIFTRLEEYNWPGNVRELRNIIERMVVISKENILTEEDIPIDYTSNYIVDKEEGIVVNGILNLPESVAKVEKTILEHALKRYSTTRQIAEAVGINQSTVVKKLKKYNLNS